MRLAVVGTIPDPDVPIVMGDAALDGDRIVLERRTVPVHRGTPALLAAAIKTCEMLRIPLPAAYLVGDTGLGEGSRRLYRFLAEELGRCSHGVIVFHYLQPDVDWHNRVLFAVEEMRPRPVLVADAGFMYAAKMSGEAEAYDLFTPDIGELAFLSDDAAPHPFYTRGFILHREDEAPERIAQAYRDGNAARCLLVKGRKDYIACGEGILATVEEPVEEAMEAIGGTGDTLTGIVTALAALGMRLEEAAVAAARVNRLAGHYSRPTPATQVTEIIRWIPKALSDVLGVSP